MPPMPQPSTRSRLPSLRLTLTAGACLLALASAQAAEPATDPAPAKDPVAAKEPAKDPAKDAAGAPKPDPTSAIVAEGRQLYRQRDLDALVLIANRHLKSKLAPSDEDELRQALIRILVAREPLVDALARLPPSLASGKAHDALVLDLLDYQAEPAKPPATSDAKPTDAKGAEAKEAAPVDAKAAPDKTADAPGAVIVQLPPLVQTRTLDKVGRRQLSLQIALYFPDAATSRAFEAKAPLIRDAILGFIHQLPAADFAEPNQAAYKKGLLAAIVARLPDFPADGILIPELEVGPPDEKDKDKDK
jgi:flagellar basal body-associated protein FliL